MVAHAKRLMIDCLLGSSVEHEITLAGVLHVLLLLLVLRLIVRLMLDVFVGRDEELSRALAKTRYEAHMLMCLLLLLLLLLRMLRLVHVTVISRNIRHAGGLMKLIYGPVRVRSKHGHVFGGVARRVQIECAVDGVEAV